MKLQGRNLKEGLEGADVALLQSELRQIGYAVPEGEAKAQSFGPGTTEAVRSFQKSHQLEETGEVDSITAGRMTLEFAAPIEGAPHATVQGTVLWADRRPLVGGTVTIARRDIAGETRVGTCVTTSAGTYSQSYRVDAKLDTPPASLKLEAVDGSSGSIVARTEVAETLPVTKADLLAKNGGDTEVERFIVRGQVRRVDGRPVGNVRVRAFDRDLRREELLGEVRTDQRGQYEVSYSSADFTRAEKDAADLQVRAFDDQENAIATSETVFNAGPAQELDLVVDPKDYRGLSEFERFLQMLGPVLDGVPLAELTAEDVRFLTGETGIPSLYLDQLVRSANWNGETDIAAEIFYGLLRQGFPEALDSLLAAGEPSHRNALGSSLAERLIPEMTSEALSRALSALHQLRLRRMFPPGQVPDTASVGALIQIALPSAERQESFASRWLRHTENGGTLDALWESLARERDFSPSEIANLQTVLELGSFTINYAPLVQELENQRRQGIWSTLPDLARLTAEDWLGIVGRVAKPDASDLPSLVPGKEPTERRQKYARKLADAVERRFPTAVMAHRLERDIDFELPHKGDVVTFLRNQLKDDPAFDLKAVPIRAHLAKQGEAAFQGINDRAGMVSLLEAIQRVQHCVKGWDQVRPLLRDGKDSAFLLTEDGFEVFVAHYSQELGGEDEAIEVYELAEQKAASAVNLWVDFHPSQTPTDLRVLPTVEPLADAIPDLRALFGSLDYCACEHCRSVLSPAAYLVDALQFLRRRPALPPTTSALDILFKRRPDIGEIELTCDNTNIEVPYIDLVNELLENAVAPIVTREEWARRPIPPPKHELFQTRRSSEELRAYPEHLHTNAYVRLRKLIYPWTLPFDLWNEEIYAYLQQLGTSRTVLIRTFHPPTSPNDPSALAIARDTLRLSATAWDAIADTSTSADRIWAGWGVPGPPLTGDLGDVPAFLERSGLSLAELTDLLATRFINPDPEQPVLRIDPPGSCDTQEMDLVELTDAVKGKIHRFVRLWRALGWPMHDVDLAVQRLGGGVLDQNCLLRLADLELVQAALRVPRSQAMALWGPLDNDGPASLYQTTFWNAALRSQFADAAFDPEQIPLSGDRTEKIPEHKPPILAALNLTSRDLDLLQAAHAADGSSISVPALTIENLSYLYRHSLLGQRLGLSMDDLLTLRIFGGFSRFDAVSTSDTLRLLDMAGVVRISPFTVEELRLLFLTPLDSEDGGVPGNIEVTGILTRLREHLQPVREEVTPVPDPAGEQVRRWLGLLKWSPAVVDDLVRTLTNQEVYSARVLGLPADFSVPPDLRQKLECKTVNPGPPRQSVLRCRGVLTTTERGQIMRAETTRGLGTEVRIQFETAVAAVYDAPRASTQRSLAAFAYRATLAEFPAQARIPADFAERLTYDPDARELRFCGPMSAAERERLRALSDVEGYLRAIDRLYGAPRDAHQPADLTFLDHAAVDGLLDEPDPALRFSALKGVASSYLSRTLGTQAVVEALAALLGMNSELLEPLLTRHLRTANPPDRPVVTVFLRFLDPRFPGADPNANILPDGPFLELVTHYRLLHRVALLISKLRVGRSEIPWLFRSADDPTAAEVNLNRLLRLEDSVMRAPATFRGWQRMIDLFRVRDRLGTEKLTTVLQLASQAMPDTSAIQSAFVARSDWRAEEVQALITALRLDSSAFRDERGLSRLIAAMDLLQQLRVSATRGVSWAALDLRRAETARAISESVQEAVRARFTPEQWPGVAKPLRDGLRQRQAAALSDYLIAHTVIDDGSRAWRNKNDLYAYFLVDVEMSTCRSMTRIKLAHSSVQLFVQRCFMNLEREVRANAAADSGWLRWRWMKKYRFWEANQQIFLYPENWIEPELRDDKSELFKELESSLLQDELTAESAEDAYLGYLDNLEALGRLEICALYRQPGNRSVLHVLGRTNGTPHIYYYRRQVRTEFSSSWTPWEKVDADIEGDILVPVIWNDRLYLFWLVIQDREGQKAVTIPSPGGQISGPGKYSDAQLAWCSRRYGKWSRKTVSKEFARIPRASESDLYLQARPVDGADLELTLSVRSITPELHAYKRKLDALEELRSEAQRELDYSSEDSARSVARSKLTAINRRILAMDIRNVTPKLVQTGFRLSGTDGSVRRLPLIPGDFIPQPRGTQVKGAIFAETVWRSSEKVAEMRQGRFPLALPQKYPEGSADVSLIPGLVLPAVPASGGSGAGSTVVVAGPPQISLDQLYTLGSQADLRGDAAFALQPDHTLRLNLPSLFGIQPLLFDLPGGGWNGNRFRVALPHNQLTEVTEFFYQDDTRTFHAEMIQDIEEIRQAESSLRPNYRFHCHYHPYVPMLVQRTQREGVDGLLQRAVQVEPERMTVPPRSFNFRDSYLPNAPFVIQPHPIEDMDFSAEGAYSHYNWELFFHVPLLIACRLSKNQRFEEAQHWFHFIFDPTDATGETVPQKYWRTRPFYQRAPAGYRRERIEELLRRLGEGDRELGHHVDQWRDHPFNPHLVARTRTTAFQRTVVMKYLDNLIAWGDNLYRQGSLESINEATQLYVLAGDILGARPPQVPATLVAPPKTYYELAPRLDGFANALVRMENLTPRPGARGRRPKGNNEQPPRSRPAPKPPLGFYFCLLPNAKLLDYWDKVAQRLFKIRHCLDLDGNPLNPSMFGEPIDPGLLVRATALGVDLRTALDDLNAPLPQYRFLVLVQKASELCAEVRGFGAALLAALEKRDAEAMVRLRSAHELSLLEQVGQVREQQLEEAKRGLEGLAKSREAITLRRDYYARAAQEFMKPGERLHLALMGAGVEIQRVAAGLELAANVLHIIPNTKLGVPTTMGFTFGGDNLGKALEAFAKYLGAQSTILGTTASMTATLAGFQRRAEEWQLQVQVADKELQQIEKQHAAAQIRVAITQKEWALHKLQRRQSEQVDYHWRSKFTSEELYEWMSGQLAEVYFQCYQMAFDMAKRAERSFRFERGLSESGFIQYGYWDSLHKGLMAGERLQMDLRRLELAYLDQNRREHELTKHISLALLDPFALHLLRTTGSCIVTLPEALFDRDHPGHFMRRIKSVALTLPAVVGPYTSVNCRLTLQSSAVRVDPDTNPSYRVDASAVSSDPRFRTDLGAVQSIATSRGHTDSGTFELNFRDERYLPFEGAGVISTWRIELDPKCNDFDLTTLSDVVIQLNYTARDGGEPLRRAVLQEVIDAPSEPGRPPELHGRLFSARTEFADAWHAFLYPIDDQPGQTLVLDLDSARFPYRAQQGTISIHELHLVLMLTEEGARRYATLSNGIRFMITDPNGNNLTPPTPDNPVGGVVLRTGGDPRVGGVPGADVSLNSVALAARTGGVNSWQFAIPQSAIDGLPSELKAPVVAGGSSRLAAEQFQDLLVFSLYSSDSPA